jgi:hypothetical protein
MADGIVESFSMRWPLKLIMRAYYAIHWTPSLPAWRFIMLQQNLKIRELPQYTKSNFLLVLREMDLNLFINQ